MMRKWIGLIEERSEAETFINELNHEIFISVHEKEIDGVDGVFIHMIGPDSETENHITREEARVLLRELRLILENNVQLDRP